MAGEYMEDSFDDWDISLSQDQELRDIDSILKPLSDSQQEIINKLDIEDDKIKANLNSGVNCEEVHSCEHKESKPSFININPPGLVIFSKQWKFNSKDLNLREDFKWEGHDRLIGNMSPYPGDSILSSVNVQQFCRCLFPGLSINHILASQDDFTKVVDYLFYCSTVTQNGLHWSVIKKTIKELLSCYPYKWTPTSGHFLTVILNFGADPDLVAGDGFFESIKELTETPCPDTFLKRKPIKQHKNVLSVEIRNFFLKRFFSFLSELLRLPNKQEELKVIDEGSWKTWIFFLTIVSQDVGCLQDAELQFEASNLLHCVLQLMPDQDHVMDAVEIITNRFLPRQLSEVACPWTEASCPSHMGEKPGHNHHHNMLHVAKFFPPGYPRVRQLLAYIYAQLILNCKSVDLPASSDVKLEDMFIVFENQLETLKSYYDDQLYAIWSLIQLVEVCVVSCPPFKYGHSDFEALKKIKEFLDQHILMRFKWIKDTKNIDLNSLVGLCTKIITRWNKKIETIENNQELKKQISAQK